MKIRIFSAAVILLILGGGIVAFRFFRRPPLSGIEAARTYSKELLNSYTPKDAYELFKKHYKSASIADAHQAAHAFGESLYAATGVEGFSVCDATFGFGCFHTFIPAAIADKGTDVIKELDQSCIKAFGPGSLGCFHGIGHGLLAYEGYTTEGVKKSLALCKTLSWKHLYGGCPEGVFMEYDFRTTIPDPRQQIRPFSEQEKYLPCTAIDSPSRTDCYFSLPSWWLVVLSGKKDRFAVMGKYCAAITSADERTGCYRGIGYAVAPVKNFEVMAGSLACDEAQSDGAECREGLAWALYADPVFRPQAETACNGISTAASAKCIRDYLFLLK